MTEVSRRLNPSHMCQLSETDPPSRMEEIPVCDGEPLVHLQFCIIVSLYSTLRDDSGQEMGSAHRRELTHIQN